MSAPADMSVELEPRMELWDLAADWIGAQKNSSTRDMLDIAATLMHLAASAWAQFVPPPEIRDVLDEETFVRLARHMFSKARPTGGVQ